MGKRRVKHVKRKQVILLAASFKLNSISRLLRNTRLNIFEKLELFISLNFNSLFTQGSDGCADILAIAVRLRQARMSKRSAVTTHYHTETKFPDFTKEDRVCEVKAKQALTTKLIMQSNGHLFVLVPSMQDTLLLAVRKWLPKHKDHEALIRMIDETTKDASSITVYRYVFV